jgi:hypothetical protein
MKYKLQHRTLNKTNHFAIQSSSNIIIRKFIFMWPHSHSPILYKKWKCIFSAFFATSSLTIRYLPHPSPLSSDTHSVHAIPSDYDPSFLTYNSKYRKTSRERERERGMRARARAHTGETEKDFKPKSIISQIYNDANFFTSIWFITLVPKYWNLAKFKVVITILM